MPVQGGLPATHRAQDAPPVAGPTAEVQAAIAAQDAAATGPRDTSELLAQALDAYRREAAGGEGAAHATPGIEADVGDLIVHALAAVAPGTEGATEKPSEEANSKGLGAGRIVEETQAEGDGQWGRGANQGACPG